MTYQVIASNMFAHYDLGIYEAEDEQDAIVQARARPGSFLVGLLVRAFPVKETW